MEKLLLSKVATNIQNKSDLQTPLHILVQAYEKNQFKGQRERIEEIIQLLLPFAEDSLRLEDKHGKRPHHYVNSNSLRVIFTDYKADILSADQASSDDDGDLEENDLDEFFEDETHTHHPGTN